MAVTINGTTGITTPANTDYKNIMALVEKGQLTIAPASEEKR
jgi:hypothetical protein